MSIEARVFVIAEFPDDEATKSAASKLRKSLKNNQHELASALHALNPIANQSDYVNDTINVEELSKKKKVISISSYTYTSEEPTWFAKSVYQLGAKKVHIRGVWDGEVRNYYFLNGESVPKKKYSGDKPKKPRVLVRANLMSSWEVGDIYESTGLQLKTLDGSIIYYVGRGGLVDAFFNFSTNQFDKSICVEFSAAVEKGVLDGTQVLFAKRPTKIVLFQKNDEGAGIEDDIYLTNERVKVEAILLSDNGVLKMETSDGKKFIYRGKSDLLELSRLEEFYQKCSFVAKFERGIYEGQAVSVATRPTDIEFTLRPEKEDEAPLWMTSAPCPYCGKPLRTKKAKLCLHCGKSWHEK